MSFEVIHVHRDPLPNAGHSPYLRESRRCLGGLLNIKDRKILVAAYGVFTLMLGIALTVGFFAIRAITSSTVHTEAPIPTLVSSTVVIASGAFITSLSCRKSRCLIIAAIVLSTIAGILSAIGTVHFGIAVGERLEALSGCLYTSVQRLCTCSVETKTSKVMYNFHNAGSCKEITTHLREVVYGMCGVYAVTFVVCFGAAVYAILLLHRIEIRKIKSQQHQFEITKEPLKENTDLEEYIPEILPGATKKCAQPTQHDVATQTSNRSTGAELHCRHQCRHFVEVTVPNTSNDYVVNVTKSRDPPPPYCETVYT